MTASLVQRKVPPPVPAQHCVGGASGGSGEEVSSVCAIKGACCSQHRDTHMSRFKLPLPENALHLYMGGLFQTMCPHQDGQLGTD